jgi:hypothetical protein
LLSARSCWPTSSTQRPDPASTPTRSPPSSAWPAGPPQETDDWASVAAGGWAYHAGITGARGHTAPTHHVETAVPQPALAPTYLDRADQAWSGTRWESTTSSARSGEVLAAVMTLALMALGLLAVLRLTLAILRRRRLAAWEAA